MGMRTRRSFLGILVASAFTAALGGTIALSEGCGGGTPQNSDFRGGYGGTWRVFGPGVAYSGGLSLTADIKGRIEGEVIGCDGSIGTLSGDIDNSGDFTASVRYGTQVNDIHGHLATQQIQLSDINTFCTQVDQTERSRQAASPSPSPSPSPSTGTGFKSGIHGDFREKINGTEYVGYFDTNGGQTTTSGG